ncbi:restriction endonuclease [Microlunatus sp. GCM10028923]|uniref:restriction endonuclease n=1 Tax=Microlunatus sp. GCM10028923 TaxID=3273400 RepID=UPI003616D78D
MLNFKELSQDGEDLEQLVRELGLALDYRVSWSGRGSDDGRDLLLAEPGDPLLGSKTRTWVVSCKHTAHAGGGNGRAVGVSDLGGEGGMIDVVDQHQADGYLLVCSTVPSSAVTRRLAAMETGRRSILTHCWDGVQLERMLNTPRGWAVAQRFMPVSSEASGWRVFATDSPNRFVGITRGFYIRLTNRHGSGLGYQLSSIDERLDRAESFDLPEGHQLRPRGMWCDDKHGAFVWYFDYLYDRPSLGEPSTEPSHREIEAIKREFGDGSVTYEDGQIDSFEITVREVDRWHDAYDADHYSFYEGLSFM